MRSYLSFCWIFVVSACFGQEDACPKDLVMLLDANEKVELKNGSMLYKNVWYPPGLHWQNELGGKSICNCGVDPPCVRRCCQEGELLKIVKDDTDKVSCISKAVSMQLRLKEEQLSPEIRSPGTLEKNFIFLRSNACFSNMRYRLEPESFPEDKFILQSNGTLLIQNFTTILPQWLYCMDWQETFDQVVIAVCLEPQLESPDPENMKPIGMIVSIPFLLATFLVYAIIPELRNLYGKTFMCYILCLIIAYCIIAIAYFRYFPSLACTIIVTQNWV
ncbi:probable G-protein coupled receptor Mth-like 6 [Prorops nasuta]|uniref:probable G-protein coupled receptor Mth-like 6 n=1 Tax=Prorops nasuta TaxID=863751 RepID=UPI0034CF0DA5